VRRIINGGGIPQRNAALNQIYANVLGKPILGPAGDVTSLSSVAGSAESSDASALPSSSASCRPRSDSGGSEPWPRLRPSWLASVDA